MAERLRSRDTRQVLKFLRDLYALRESDAFTSHLVANLPKLISADAYTYNEMDHARGQASYKLWPADFTPLNGAQEILGRFAHQIPMHAHWEGGDGQALKISDFLSPHAFKKKDIYNEFYHPMRIPFTMGIALPVNRRRLVTIGAHRSGKDFTEQERTALNLIQPHVFQAYENAQAVTHMQAELVRLNHAIDQLQQGVMSISARGFIKWTTARARELLERYFGRRTRSHQRLPDVLVRWLRCCEAQFDAPEERPGIPAAIVMDHGSYQLKVRMVPEGDHHLLFLEERSTEMPTDHLACLGLSRRETEILGWIVRGKSNPEIAMILGISVRTIHKHVERIYLKMGVENRHAAISVAFEAMRNASC
jgi:DNA-binding CsgD family transcriptional regulator